ncbi:hypothetical protein D3C78_1115520 [compost metagenome]
MAVAVEVHRVGAEAARHELRQAHGAGVGALEGQRVDLLLAGQQEELAQLLAEEVGARRIVEAEGGQRVDHPPVAGVAAEEGFHADDRHDHLRRHPVLALGTRQRLGMLVPELHAAADARVGEEDRPVLLPRLDPLGRPRDGVEDRLLALHLGEQRLQLGGGEALVADQFADEFVDHRRSLIVPGQRRSGDADQADQGNPSPRPCAQSVHRILHSRIQSGSLKPGRSTSGGCGSTSKCQNQTSASPAKFRRN